MTNLSNFRKKDDDFNQQKIGRGFTAVLLTMYFLVIIIE